MPSWNDGETSSESLLSDFQFEPDVPESIYDPEYYGIDPGEAVCDHGFPLHRYVAFEGKDTGRRFVGCGCQDKGICDKVTWVDGEWPDTLQKSLVRLWQLYEEEKDNRIKEGVANAEENYKLVLEKREVERVNIVLRKELGNSLSLEQVHMVSEGNLENEKLMRKRAEEQRDKLKEEKRKLEFYIADLLKAGKVNKDKLKKISEICGE